MKFSLPTFFAWIISILFHPLIISSFGAIVILFWYPEYRSLHIHGKSQFFTMFFIFTYVLPLLAIPLYFFVIKLTKSTVTKHHIRLFLLITTTAIYTFAYTILKDFDSFSMVNMYLLVCSVLMLLSLIITYFWKISLHMIGIGGFIGLLSALLLGSGVFDMRLFSLSILLAGGVGFARLQLKAHTHIQVYTGFSLGFIVSFSHLYLVFISS